VVTDSKSHRLPRQTDTAGMEKSSRSPDPLHPGNPQPTRNGPTRGPATSRNREKVKLGIISVAGGRSQHGSSSGDAGRRFHISRPSVGKKQGPALRSLVQNRTQTRRLLSVEKKKRARHRTLREKTAAWINLSAELPGSALGWRRILWTTGAQAANGRSRLHLERRAGLIMTATTKGFGLWEYVSSTRKEPTF